MKFWQIGLILSVAAFSNLSQASAPQPPTNVRAIAYKGKVTVMWDAPTDTGGLPVNSYTARYAKKGPKCTVKGMKNSCTVTGLRVGLTSWYTFYVTARNKDGTSSPSADSQVVVPYKKDVDAQCGTANGIYMSSKPDDSTELCLAGFTLFINEKDNGTYYWTCHGLRQGNSDNCVTSSTVTYKAGDRGPAGGTVIFVTPDKQHGIEAATVPLYATAWGCDGTYVGANGTNVGTGKDNTTKILAACPDSLVANIANKEKLYGYDDWYIPSRDEIVLAERALAGAELGNEFWTSSEVSASLVTMYHRRVAPCTNPPPFGDCFYEYISEPGTKSCSGYYPGYVPGAGCWVLPVRDF